MKGETIRIVGIRKSPDEPLGLTVEQDDNGNLVVARILGGGMIDRQGLLNVGDVILEVNGEDVDSPEGLQLEISRAKEKIILKIGPGRTDAAQLGPASAQVINGGAPGTLPKKLTVRNLFVDCLSWMASGDTGAGYLLAISINLLSCFLV